MKEKDEFFWRNLYRGAGFIFVIFYLVTIKMMQLAFEGRCSSMISYIMYAVMMIFNFIVIILGMKDARDDSVILFVCIFVFNIILLFNI